jgi:hypothetical protein
MKSFNFFFYKVQYLYGENGRSRSRSLTGAGAEIFDKLEPEPHKNGPAPQLCLY